MASAKTRGQNSTSELIEAIADPLTWLQFHTRTRDSHWRESGASTPYRPFPDKPYFRPVIQTIQNEPVVFVEKSRDLMISWLCVGFFTHAAMTNDQREVLFQSQKEDKAAELVDYAKTLYEEQDERLKRRFPLAKPLKEQAALRLEFANGSRITGIPEGVDQIRSYHPWACSWTRLLFSRKLGRPTMPPCQFARRSWSSAPRDQDGLPIFFRE